MNSASTQSPRSGADALDGAGISLATGGALLRASNRKVRGGAVDSRKVASGNVFFALAGEHTDGHRFLRDAASRQAGALVVSRPLADDELDALCALVPGGLSIVKVPDGLRALHAVAAAWRERFDPVVVGVTGSVGKTSTKEAIASVLSTGYKTLRSEGNENNEIGLPLTLLRLDRTYEAAVVEMGMYVAGEIAELAAMARPRVGVVTAVRGIHIERAGTIDDIERGKGQLIEALPADGVAILNGDDARVRRMTLRTHARSIFYGFRPDSDVTAEAIEPAGAEGMRFALRLPGASRAALPVRLPALGRHGVQNALAAAAVGHALGMTGAEIVAGLELGWTSPHRDQLFSAGPWRILDDSYNAGPDSMRAALDLLATLPGRHVAVLGAMLELGPDAPALHREVGVHAAARADLLLVVGEGARPIAEGARSAGMPGDRVLEAPDRDVALARLIQSLEPADTVLFKGSRGAALDELAGALVAAAGTGVGATPGSSSPQAPAVRQEEPGRDEGAGA